MSQKANIGKGYFNGIDSSTLGEQNLDRIGAIGIVDYMVGVYLLLTVMLLFRRSAKCINKGETFKGVMYLFGIGAIGSGIVFYFGLGNNITQYLSKFGS